MSGALVPRAYSAAPASRVACRVPDRRVATFTASEELPPGIPAQVTFVAAHHCAGCGQPRSHAYHKENPLIPGQVAPASLCRKCEKKIAKGKPIDSIVLPIRDFPPSDEEGNTQERRRGRRRSTSRTKIIIKHESGEREPSPPTRGTRKLSSDLPKRTISYRHVHSRSLSRPAAVSKPAEPQRQLPFPPQIRPRSPPASHREYIIEHVRSEKPVTAPERAPPAASLGHTTDPNKSFHSYMKIDAKDEPQRRGAQSEEEAQAPGRNTYHDLPAPPIGLSALQSKRTFNQNREENVAPPQSAHRRRPSTFDKFVQGIFRGRYILN